MSSKVSEENFKHGLEDPRRSESGRRLFSTFRQLNALTGMVVLSAMGMVSVQDWAFCSILFSIRVLLIKSCLPNSFPSTTFPSVR